MIVEFAAEAHGADEALDRLDALLDRFREQGFDIEREGLPALGDSEDGEKARASALCTILWVRHSRFRN
jgi:hypothetical protein